MPRLTAMPSRLAAPAPRVGAAPGDARAQDRTRARATPWRAWYASARWRKLRRQIAARDGWTCRQSGIALVGAANEPNALVIDHIRPHRGDPALFWDPENLQAVSKEWHDSVKQAQERAAR